MYLIYTCVHHSQLMYLYRATCMCYVSRMQKTHIPAKEPYISQNAIWLIYFFIYVHVPCTDEQPGNWKTEEDWRYGMFDSHMYMRQTRCIFDTHTHTQTHTHKRIPVCICTLIHRCIHVREIRIGVFKCGSVLADYRYMRVCLRVFVCVMKFVHEHPLL